MAAHRPDGIIKTISAKCVKENGGHEAMCKKFESLNDEEHIFWLRSAQKPKHEVLYAYIVWHGKIQYRCNIAGVEQAEEGEIWVDNEDGTQRPIKGHQWIILTSPVIKPPYDISKKGFQGFRYTQQIF